MKNNWAQNESLKLCPQRKMHINTFKS
uniref:Uncharacterized protein n=1 Tax=Lepeophtheirus salmonis TaxID=72036 RepID=A0A0K2T4Y6_LEPSM